MIEEGRDLMTNRGREWMFIAHSYSRIRRWSSIWRKRLIISFGGIVVGVA
jgi:hypothetical protein